MTFDCLSEGADTAEKRDFEPVPGSTLPVFNAHILVVEDDRISQRMSRSVLREVGCTCDIACNGQEALDLLADKWREYDVILMDWQMPVMDGHEAMRAIRKTTWWGGLKMIALTANAVQGDREKCLAAGANDYMSKPVRVSDVVKTLSKIL